MVTTVGFGVADAEMLKLHLHVVDLSVVAPPDVHSRKQADPANR